MRGLVAEAGPRKKPHRLRTSHLQTPWEATAHLRNPLWGPPDKTARVVLYTKPTKSLQRRRSLARTVLKEEEVAKEEEEAADSSS